MNEIINIKELTVSSREIADLTGKRHDHVKRDIRTLTDWTRFMEYETRPYTDCANRSQEEYLINAELRDLLMARYKGLARVPLRLQEEAALKTIEQLLGIRLLRQFAVGKYHIDGYDPESNTAYEIDERQHGSPAAKKADTIRQRDIIDILECTFVRISI